MSPKKNNISAPKLMDRLVGGTYSELANYSDLFLRTSDAIFLLNIEDFSILECNPAVQSLFGLDAKSILGANLSNFFLENSSENLNKMLREVGTQESSFNNHGSVDCYFESSIGGNLCFEVTASRLKLADYCEVLQVIAKDVTLARENAKKLREANRNLADLANTDEMTKVFNVRYLKSQLKQEHDRASRYGRPYSLILCDIDHFKNYNDQNGHPEGDEALKILAATLKKRARTSDIVARYGGEEFVILCPEVDGEKAMLFAESLRAIIETTKFPFGHKQPLGKVSVSVGVASYPLHGNSPEEVLKASDVALYNSKSNGRNQVSLFSETIKKQTPKKAA